MDFEIYIMQTQMDGNVELKSAAAIKWKETVCDNVAIWMDF